MKTVCKTLSPDDQALIAKALNHYADRAWEDAKALNDDRGYATLVVALEGDAERASQLADTFYDVTLSTVVTSHPMRLMHAKTRKATP